MTYRYITIQEALKLNGDRHHDRGINYLKQGNLEYALGSFRKMIRNYEASYQLDSFCKAVDCQDLVDKLSRDIAKSIFNGSNNAKGGLHGLLG